MGENGAVTAAPRLPPPRWRRLAPALLPLLSVAIIWHKYLLATAPWQWQLDLEVYREAGVSIINGRPVYEALTPPPQLLPFTYPPFAAILAIPLALVPFTLAGWVWSIAQAGAVFAATWYAGSPLWRRCGRHSVLAWAVFTAVALRTIPVMDGFRFGQVDMFLLLPILLDLLRARVVRWIPHGVCVGLATAIKLTPGIFIVHLLVTRQWRAATTAIATAAGATLVSFVLLPQASFAFWGGALQDPARLGRNDDTSNQSIRGVLLRLLGQGTTTQLLWLALAATAAVCGLAAARRAHVLGLRRLEISAVALTGLLVSPVSWIHHFAWLLVVIPAVWGRSPLADRRRLIAGLGLLIGFLLDLPWWGQWRLVNPGTPFLEGHSTHPFWTLMNNAYFVLAVIALALVAWAVHVSQRATPAADRQ